MARQDMRVKDGSRWHASPYQTKAGNTAINAGEMTLQGAGGDVEYAIVATNGADNSVVWIGLAVSNDTVTASTDGIVYVVDSPNALFVARPTTSANLASTIVNTRVTYDVTAGVHTIDENDTVNGCLLIQSYDADRNEVYFRIDETVHIWNS